MEYPGFCGSFATAQSRIADQERLVNWYEEPSESQAASTRRALYPTPGVEEIAYLLPAMQDPEVPTITQQGTPGASTYVYAVVALLTDGVTHTAFTGATTTTGNAVLSGVDFNRITWPAVTNASFYDVYAQPGGSGDIFLIANNITLLTFDDIGAGGPLTTPPTTNTSGLPLIAAGTGRGNFFDTSSQREFVVIGPAFYELTQGLIAIWRGAVTDDGQNATISSNGDAGDELFITSGMNGYLFTVSTSVFASIAALAGIARMGDHIDGYFMALDDASSTLFLSDQYDGATWDPTNFIQRSQQADPWISFKVAGRYVWLLGTQTSEAWYDAGTASILAPHPSGVIQYGCAAQWSTEVVSGGLMWLSETVNGIGAFIRLNGFSPEAVSGFNLDNQLNAYGDVSDAIGDTYEDLGHPFYIVTFPNANKTWCWDAATQKWHERMTWISENFEESAWRPLYHSFAYNIHIMLDRESGKVYRLSSDFGTDVDDREIRRIRRAPAIVDELNWITYSLFEVFLEAGLGLGSGQGSNPLVMMRYSNDGGKTWQPSRMVTAGAMGAYSTRVRFLRCGRARNRTFEISVSDPTPWRVMGAFLQIERSRPAQSKRSPEAA